jgi:hypothetical protein
MKTKMKLLASFFLGIVILSFVAASCTKNNDEMKPPTNEPLPVPRRG